jgi:hypothetical protein
MFARRMWESEADFFEKNIHHNAPNHIMAQRRGYTHLEYARLRAAWTVYDHFRGAFSWEPVSAPDAVVQQLGTYQPESTAAMSAQVKASARMYGASLVGICELDRRWIYTHDRGGNQIEIPPQLKYAIVMAIKMDAEAIMTSPKYEAGRATGIGYSRMAHAIACLAEFIRHLGYQAIPMGNDTSLSIPIPR